MHTGEGVLRSIWHTYRIIEHYTPQLVAGHARGAPAARRDLRFAGDQRLHYPLALIAMALLPVLMLLAWRGALPADIGELAAAVTLALLGNAFVCGALANPHDRYGARMVWLAASPSFWPSLAWRRADRSAAWAADGFGLDSFRQRFAAPAV